MVALERRDGQGWRIEEVLSVKFGVTEKFKQNAMELVGAAASGYIDLAGAAAELRLEKSALYFELLKGINGGKQQVAREVDVGVFDAIEGVAIEGEALAADADREVAASSSHAELGNGRVDGHWWSPQGSARQAEGSCGRSGGVRRYAGSRRRLL